MIATLLRCLGASLALHVTVLGTLYFASEALFRKSPNLAAILVSTTGFLWFLGHSLMVTRLAERRLGVARRATAIGITVGISVFELVVVFVVMVIRALLAWQA
jgi:hypothetical protein